MRRLPASRHRSKSQTSFCTPGHRRETTWCRSCMSTWKYREEHKGSSRCFLIPHWWGTCYRTSRRHWNRVKTSMVKGVGKIASLAIGHFRNICNAQACESINVFFLTDVIGLKGLGNTDGVFSGQLIFPNTSTVFSHCPLHWPKFFCKESCRSTIRKRYILKKEIHPFMYDEWKHYRYKSCVRQW